MKLSYYYNLITNTLVHGCARVAHCATARWRNYSHYYCPLRLSYVFWAQWSTGLCADSTRCTQTRVHSAREKNIVRQWSRREASLRHSSGWWNWSVSPQYRDLRTRALVYVPSKFLFKKLNLFRSNKQCKIVLSAILRFRWEWKGSICVSLPAHIK